MIPRFLRVPVLAAWLAFWAVEGPAVASDGEGGTTDAGRTGPGAGYREAERGGVRNAPESYAGQSPGWDADYLCGAGATASSTAYLSAWRNGSRSWEEARQPSVGGQAEQVVMKTRIASTKIPGSAWLVASGILCLIGLKRKK